MSFLIPDRHHPPHKSFCTFSPGPFEILATALLLAAALIGVAAPLIQALRIVLIRS